MFSSLFRRDPTRNFKRSLVPPLSWNTRKGSLCDIVLGEHLETIEPLGPSSHHNSANKGHHYLEYADLGVIIVVIDEHTDTMIFPMSQIEEVAIDPDFEATAVRIRPEGLTVTSSTREEDVEQVFGAPRERDVDEDTISVQHDVDRLTFEFDFALDGQLVAFSVFTRD